MALADIISECTFKAVRSGGKGGQNVNKTSTKVEVYFSIADSTILTEAQKTTLQAKLGHLISSDGYLRLTCEEERSQKGNKEIVTEKLLKLIEKALIPPRKRVKTHKPKSADEKRLTTKKRNSEKKSNRRGGNED